MSRTAEGSHGSGGGGGGVAHIEIVARSDSIPESLKRDLADRSSPSPSKRSRTDPFAGMTPQMTPQMNPAPEREKLEKSSSSHDLQVRERKTNSILNYVSKSPPNPLNGGGVSTEKLNERNTQLNAREATLAAKERNLGLLLEQLETAKRALEMDDQKIIVEKNKMQQQSRMLQSALRESLVSHAKRARLETTKDLVERQQRLGQIVYRRQGVELTEMFEHGPMFREVNTRLACIEYEGKCIEKMKKFVMSRKRVLSKEATHNSGNTNSVVSEEMGPPPVPDDVQISFDDILAPSENVDLPMLPPLSNVVDCVEVDEVLKLRAWNLKKEEALLQAERDELEMQKLLLIRDIKRKRDEDRSMFNTFPILSDERYILLRLIGKGGFSEVWEAYDLTECRRVACKIHQLNSQWSEERKQSYIKHAMREYQIHRRLIHHRVVRLHDVFEIDHTSFCTVLEYCDGVDLDTYLKLNKGVLSEREARSIVSQIVTALKFFSDQRPRIIHYDLKPANILVHKGSIKITDFGLSKIMDGDQDSIELTSQGAGTYWYLPPECFGTQSKISPKVDVWGTGVIFYEMLVGRRPFGHDMTQQRILADRTILNINRVDFPQACKISQEARDFLVKCLEPSQYLRPDVQDLYDHPYLRGEKKTKDS
eukprot:ANDGO_06259.mRNA.1 Serine/threonine-protein kinase TOUSLED